MSNAKYDESGSGSFEQGTVQPAAVKICGLQDVEVLKSMINLPVDYIGVVFANSRRRITPEQAAELKSVLFEWSVNERPKLAGVFVNPTMEELEHVMETVYLDVIQLHGQERAEFCQQVKEKWDVDVFKAVSFSKEETAQNQNDVALQKLDTYVGFVDTILLDTFDPLYGGGSGKTFAWDRIPAYAEWAHQHGISMFVAGGLAVDNVQELLQAYRPYGVDVSSGVETEGLKDITKIKAFVERVKQA
ncbi:MAG: phosphoribosylanthranilate isomerase [Paenibacillus sp.]|uniref:phosphoribosylanthranilate isomerase n=1 Tax=Paenibacillus sp. TaxID=58172 RepID=UPI0025D66644|nr:phosphoribosylanthranilate isomerase [Paenibacillus sp.]MBR2563238.1 phosphoribosylanthranilate isomerase [Paenibacillus sp.]